MNPYNPNNAVKLPETNFTAPFGFFLLCIYTALAFIRPQEWPVFATEAPILRSILIGAFLFYLATLRPKAWNTQCGLLLLLTLTMLLSEIRAGRGVSELENIMSWIYSGIIPFIMYFGFLTSFNRQKWVLFITTLACLVMVYHGFTQLQSPSGEGWGSRIIHRTDGPSLRKQVRYIGIFRDPNDMGMFLVMHVPIAFFLWKVSKSFFLKASYIAVSAIMVVGIIWTGSRGSLLGLLAILSAIFYVRYGRAKSLILAGLTFPVVIAALGFRSISKNDDSAAHRLISWNEGLNMWGHRPIVGFGKGRYLEYHPKVAHNSYVEIMGELGTFGYVLWMMFLTLCVYFAVTVLKLDKSKATNLEAFEKERILAQYLLYSMIGFCVTAFFISRSYIIHLYVFAAMIAAMYLRASHLHPGLQLELPKGLLMRIFILSFVSLFVLRFLVKVLLII